MDNPEDKSSLEGKGWDILAGGKQRASEAGGDDPFDLEAASDAPAGQANPFDEPVGASLAGGGPNPFGDDPSAEILDSGHGTSMPENVPQETYGDWGRGGDRADPSRGPGAAGVPEPRELSPEELGYRPGGSPAPATMSGPPRDLTPEDFIHASTGTSDAPPQRLVSSAASPSTGKPLSDGVDVSSPNLPPSETSQVAGVSRFAGEAASADFQVYDPFEPVGEPPSYGDPGEELPLDPGIGPVLVTPERVDALWDEINVTYEAAVREVRGDFASTDTILVELKRARELLLSGLENFDNAEVIVKRVQAKLEKEDKVRGWSRTVGSWIAVYLVAWLGTLVLLTMIQSPVVDTLTRVMPRDMAAAYVPALWGALGGVLGGLWVLIEHTARKRDFDPIHTRWYVLNPFMGMGLGVVVYALFQMGVIVGGAGTGVVSPQAADITERTPWLLYGFCLVIGFQQNALWDLMDRLLRVVRGGDAAPKETVPGEAITSFD